VAMQVRACARVRACRRACVCDCVGVARVRACAQLRTHVSACVFPRLARVRACARVLHKLMCVLYTFAGTVCLQLWVGACVHTVCVLSASRLLQVVRTILCDSCAVKPLTGSGQHVAARVRRPICPHV
jgi:hypothetical protein